MQCGKVFCSHIVVYGSFSGVGWTPFLASHRWLTGADTSVFSVLSAALKSPCTSKYRTLHCRVRRIPLRIVVYMSRPRSHTTTCVLPSTNSLSCKLALNWYSISMRCLIPLHSRRVELPHTKPNNHSLSRFERDWISVLKFMQTTASPNTLPLRAETARRVKQIERARLRLSFLYRAAEFSPPSGVSFGREPSQRFADWSFFLRPVAVRASMVENDVGCERGLEPTWLQSSVVPNIVRMSLQSSRSALPTQLDWHLTRSHEDSVPPVVISFLTWVAGSRVATSWMHTALENMSLLQRHRGRVVL